MCLCRGKGKKTKKRKKKRNTWGNLLPLKVYVSHGSNLRQRELGLQQRPCDVMSIKQWNHLPRQMASFSIGSRYEVQTPPPLRLLLQIMRCHFGGILRFHILIIENADNIIVCRVSTMKMLEAITIIITHQCHCFKGNPTFAYLLMSSCHFLSKV